MFPVTNYLSKNDLSEVDSLIEFLKSYQINMYFRFVCAALLVYDYTLTFSDEANLIWRRGLNLISVTYYAVRYLPFFDILGLSFLEQYWPNADVATCRTVFSIYSFSILVGVDLANCILTLRTFVIWNKDKRILAALVVALLASIAGEAFYMTKFLNSLRFIDSPVPFLIRSCFIVQAEASYAWAAYLVLLILESVIFALTLIKYFQDPGTRRSFVIQTIYRDGLLFYIFILGISLINIALLKAEWFNNAYGTLLTNIHRVLHAILSTRLVLNIRKAGSRRTIASRP